MDLKTELYENSVQQEFLLQQYRIYGFTFLSIMIASCVGLIATTQQLSVGNDAHQCDLALSWTVSVMETVVAAWGIWGTAQFQNITRQRSNAVTFFHAWLQKIELNLADTENLKVRWILKEVTNPGFLERCDELPPATRLEIRSHIRKIEQFSVAIPRSPPRQFLQDRLYYFFYMFFPLVIAHAFIVSVRLLSLTAN